jgi:hypothetical protein
MIDDLLGTAVSLVDIPQITLLGPMVMMEEHFDGDDEMYWDLLTQMGLY